MPEGECREEKPTELQSSLISAGNCFLGRFPENLKRRAWRATRNKHQWRDSKVGKRYRSGSLFPCGIYLSSAFLWWLSCLALFSRFLRLLRWELFSIICYFQVIWTEEYLFWSALLVTLLPEASESAQKGCHFRHLWVESATIALPNLILIQCLFIYFW